MRLSLSDKTTRVPGLPSVLDIEPTTVCNLKCKMCQVPLGYFGDHHLSFEDFRRILAQFPHLVRIKLQGMGEPFLNKDIFKMISHAGSRDIVVCTTTNGVPVSETMARKILESGLDEIYFSVDGATSETFESIRTGARFDRVITNLRQLVEMKGNSKKPLIGVWFVSLKENTRELPDLVRLCSKIGVQRLAVQLDLCYWGKDDLREKIEEYELEANEKDRYLREAERLAEEHKLEFIIQEEKLAPGKMCDWPWYSAYITAEGKVVPCCLIADAKLINMGDLGKEQIKDIWNGAAYQAFRKSLIDGNIPDYCRNCFPETDRSPES
jgi:radical SAM protein with 4Fe4S-binding SPASM domain